MASFAFALAHLAPAAVLALLAVALGRRLLELLAPRLRAAAPWGLPLAVGLGTLACAASLLAVFGILTRAAILALLASIGLATASRWPSLWRDIAATWRQASPWSAGLVVAALPGSILALDPPTGFDALLYHLPAAARFAATGRLGALPELRFPAFPWLNEVLFSVALSLQDDVLAQCLEWVAYLGTAAILWELCTRRSGRWAAVLAVSLWLGDPLVAWLAASAYIEPLVGLFIVGTVAALVLGEEGEDRHAALLAGGLAGCAAATKYQGLLAVALIPVWVVARGTPAVAWTTRVRTAGPALLVAAIVALPWYIWIAMVTGDPIFPLLTRLSHAAPAAPAQGWSAVLHPGGGIRRTWWPYPPGSPWLWLLWPLPLLGWRRAPLAGKLAASGLAITVVIAVLNPDARLLTVALPLLSGALAIGLGSLALAQGNAARRALVVFALAAVLPGWLYLAHLVVARGPLPTTSAERDAYLGRELPGYRALAWLNARDPKRSTVYGLAAENLRYYAAGRFLGDWYGPASFSEVLALRDHAAALHAQLAALGVDHLLVRRVAGDLDLTGTWFRAEYADDDATVWALTGAGEGH